MPRYEYKVVPAPTKGTKAKGLKTPEARFSHAIQALMNQMAENGWEYQRAETLPSVERSGLTSTTTEWRNLLVFRRLRETDTEAFAPELLPAPEALAEEPEEEELEAHSPAEEEAEEQKPLPAKVKSKANKADEEEDNGVEDTGDIKSASASLSVLAANRKSAKPKD